MSEYDENWEYGEELEHWPHHPIIEVRRTIDIVKDGYFTISWKIVDLDDESRTTHHIFMSLS